MSGARRFVPLAVVTVLLLAGVVWAFGDRGGDKTVTAYFPRAVSVYEGSDVRVLGVAVGQVDEVVPEGTKVKVVMSYDADVEVAADTHAAIVSPSVVGDRYVQLTKPYVSGDVLADNTVIQVENTAIPLELDEVFGSIDDLTVALGPDGANREGAVSDLLEQTAKNFGGQGAAFHQTIKDFGTLSQTLDNNKDSLFASTKALEGFVKTLADNDQTVQGFNRSLGNVSTLLSDERQELSEALKHLGVGLDVVARFVKNNRAVLGRDIKGLNRVAKVLVRQRAALDEILDAGPLAVDNLARTYNQSSGTLDTNANLDHLVQEILKNPANTLCGILAPADNGNQLCDLLNNLLPRTAPFAGKTAKKVAYDPTLAGLTEVYQR